MTKLKPNIPTGKPDEKKGNALAGCFMTIVGLALTGYAIYVLCTI